jgi:hypothetical protein
VQVNTKMQAELRHIVMLLDNAPTHIPPETTKEVLMGFDVYRLSNITIIFLPANTTSIVQPLDQGIIAAFKAHYRLQLVQFVIHTLDNNPDLTLQQVKIDAYSAVRWVRHAAKALTQATIRNCWWKAGILGEDKVPAPPPRAERRRNAHAGNPQPPAAQVVSNPPEDVLMLNAEGEADDEAPAICFEVLEKDLTSLATLVARRPGVLEGGDSLLSAADYTDLLGEHESFTPLSDAELVQLVLSDNAPGLVDVLDTDEQIIPEYSLSDCLTALELIHESIVANSAFSTETEEKLADVINQVSYVLRNSATQANITEYFASVQMLYPYDALKDVRPQQCLEWQCKA